MNKVLSTGELAQRLKMSKGTLCNWRTAKPKRGPRYIKRKDTGRIYYRLDDVLEYEKEQTQIIET
jgi:hypothetical protein|tara:strand:- start:233 stop:427 length:195 start_codon:yes stop_codon:yes gene_type:complete